MKIAIAFFVVALTTTTIAQAADDDAEKLFERGRTLMTERRFEEACPLLARSQEMDPADGTLLALGLCHEQIGANVKAWTELDEVLARTIVSGREDRQRVARTALQRVGAKVGRIIVQISNKGGDIAKHELRKDGLVLPKASLGKELAVEPGAHAVQLRSGDRIVWETQATIFSGSVSTIIVPIPENEPPAQPVPQPVVVRTTKPTASSSTLRYVSYGLLGTGTASLIAGGVFGGFAFSSWSSVEDRCGGNPRACVDRGAQDDANAAASAATMSNVFLIAGAVLVVSGILTYLAPWQSSSSSPSKTARR